VTQMGGRPAHATVTNIVAADDLLGGGSAERTAVRLDDRSCCCSAPPAIRVVIVRPTPVVHSVDLLLCGHHYRACSQKLARIGAMVFDRDGSLLSPPPSPD
jgi:hypothetical protein